MFSSPTQLAEIAVALKCYMRLPLSPQTIPGAYLEALIAHVHQGKVLETYDFVDVLHTEKRVGWQVKSTKESTPVTWKRAKIANKTKLIEESHKSASGLQALGDAIVGFCNEHAGKSFAKYPIDAIGYSRIIVHPDRRVTYFERQLCTRKSPTVFKAGEFEWRWTLEKVTKGKEQKPSLHGIHRKSGRKWFAAHILGENQLHFAGESVWWPKAGSHHTVTFDLPDSSGRLTLAELIAFFEKFDAPS